MTLRVRLAALVLATAAALGRASGAGPPASPPWLGAPFAADAASLVAAAAPLAAPAGSTIDVLLSETELHFDEAGRLRTRERLVYRLLDQDAIESWGHVDRSWAPWHQERPLLRARVVAPDGSETWLDPATLVETGVRSSDPEVYSDRRSLTAPLPRLLAGAIVEETSELQDREPYFAPSVNGRTFFVHAAPVRTRRIVLDAPQSLPLRYALRGIDGVEPQRSLDGDRVRLRFEAHDLPLAGPLEQPSAPFHRPRFPHVAYAAGGGWDEVAAAYSRLVDRQLADFNARAVYTSPIGAPQTDHVSALLAFTHGATRYAALVLGEAAITPTPPAETLRRGFGDCKDKSALLVALLRSEGIPAYLALLSSGVGPDVEPDLPGLDLFDHAIVYVPGASPVWIDPTDPDSPAGELPAVVQGRWALVASPNTTGLVRTPTAQATANQILEERELTFADLGQGGVVEVAEYRGAAAREQRAWLRQTPAEERRKSYADYVANAYLGTLDAATDGEPQDFSQPLRSRLEVSSAGRVASSLADAAVAIVPAGVVDRFPNGLLGDSDPGERSEDLVLPVPFVTEWRYKIHPPAGLVPGPLPAPIERTLGPATYAVRFEAKENGEVEGTLRFDSGPRLVAAADVEALFDGVAEIATAPAILLTFVDPCASALEEGDPHRAARCALGEIAAEPERAVHRLRFASLLVELGLGDEARRQAETAVLLAPELALAHWVLGQVRQHDALGRLRGAGYDHAGAIAAFERAHELDPDLDAASFDLAIALEHASDGTRYGPGCDLARAIELHRAWLAAHPDAVGHDLELLLGRDLLRSGRFAEVAGEPGLRSHGTELEVVRLTALALSDGVEAAFRKGSSLRKNAAEAVELLASTAQELVIARRYELAAALTRRIAPRSANPTALVSHAERLEKVQRWEELPPPEGLDGFLRRYLVAIAASDPNGDAVVPFLHPRLAADPVFRTILRLNLVLARQRTAELPPDVAADLAASALELLQEGEPPAVRVRFQGQGISEDWLYLAEQDGEWRQVAETAFEEHLGRVALEALDDGRPDVARRWLGWAAGATEAEPAGDPVPADAFAALLPAADGADDPALLAAAALALWAGEDDRGETVDRLRAAAAAAAEPPRRLALEVATVDALAASGRLEEADRLSAELLAAQPASKNAWLLRARILARAEAWEAHRKLVEARLAQHPEDPVATLLRTESAFRENRLDDAVAIFERLDREGKLAPDRGANEWAWALLFRDPVPQEALGIARRAAEASQFQSSPTLHTLASVHAALGQPNEARRVLLQAVEARSSGVPIADDWWVLGRIAEDLGLPAAARELYERVLTESGEVTDPAATAVLARRRLAGLPPPARKPGKKPAKRL